MHNFGAKMINIKYRESLLVSTNIRTDKHTSVGDTNTRLLNVY
jgi:hypothetical protein